MKKLIIVCALAMQCKLRSADREVFQRPSINRPLTPCGPSLGPASPGSRLVSPFNLDHLEGELEEIALQYPLTPLYLSDLKEERKKCTEVLEKNLLFFSLNSL